MTGQITTAVAHDGAYAVLVLMALDAVLPLGGELTMLYAGVLAAGAIGAHVTLFGTVLPFGAVSFAALVLAGTVGSLVGGLAGYAAGAWGGQSLIERPPRWLHLDRERIRRAQAWTERHGAVAIFAGRLTPLVRSFVSIPAGMLRSGLGAFTVATVLAALVWCCAFAGLGWALAGAWRSVHDGFRYADYAVVVAATALIGGVAIRRARRGARLRPEA